MKRRARYLFPLLALSIFYGCAAGILTPSHHDTEEYSNAFAAASQGNLAELQAEVSHDRSLLKITEWDGMTLLHDAVDKSQLAAAKYLIAEGADVLAPTKDGRTPLHIASQHGNIEMISLLLDHGAKINPVDNERMTPFDRATKWAHSDAAAYLKEHGGHSAN